MDNLFIYKGNTNIVLFFVNYYKLIIINAHNEEH